MSCIYLLECESLSRDQLRKHNVTDLQATLAQLNLSSAGKKHELVDRLFQFWLELQNPGASHVTFGDLAVGPTSSVRFRLPHPLDISDLRIRLEQIGQITAMLIDPEDGACLVTFKSHDTAQRLIDQALEFGIDGAKFTADADLERRSRQLDILPDHAQINNVVQKRFRKTVAEPRIYWAPAIDADDL